MNPHIESKDSQQGWACPVSSFTPGSRVSECWSSSTLATLCEELTHWKGPWCWERLKAGGEGDNRGWDGWKASPTYWTWVWASSRSWWWTEKPGVLQPTGLQRVGHDWVTELNLIFTMKHKLKMIKNVWRRPSHLKDTLIQWSTFRSKNTAFLSKSFGRKNWFSLLSNS